MNRAKGFRAATQASDLKDKDLVLRVLEMYPDVEKRESEIKNMAATYNELRENILPQLRRSEIVVQFKDTPVPLFGAGAGAPNKLILRLQPDEGVRMWLNMKEPGPGGLRVKTAPLDLSFDVKGQGPVEVQLVMKTHDFFGKIESTWKE